MQKLLFVFIFTFTFIITTSILASTFESPANPSDELIICFKEEISSSVSDKYDVLDRNEELNCVLVRAREGIIQKALADANVKYAEKNKLVHALYTPNDPYYISELRAHTGE